MPYPPPVARRSSGACTTLLILWCLVFAAPAAGQVTLLEDVSPDTSDHDATDPDGATGGRVNGTAVDPNNASILYAASEWGGLYKSTDGGDKWARLDGHRPTVVWDVEVDPSNSNRVYATSFYDGRTSPLSGINVSTDGGTTWTHPDTARPPDDYCANVADQTELTAFGIGISPADNATVYIGTSCGLAVTTDSGVTWTFDRPDDNAGAVRIWDVVPAGGGGVDMCGDDGHYYRNSTGTTWVAGNGLPAGRCSMAVSPYDNSNLNLFATVGTSIYEATNGVTWVETRTNPTPQGRIPFVATNARSTDPAGTIFDLWFGDVSLHSVTCDKDVAGSNCGTLEDPAWAGPFTRTVGGHDDMGSILFDPTAATDACPILMSSDGGVYKNTESTSPDCHTPSWEQPEVTPHGLWPFAMDGADRAGAGPEDLYFGNQDNGVFGSLDAGADTPTWTNQVCCDGFDTAADDVGGGAIIYSVCCFGGGGRANRFFKRGAGFAGGAQIAYPAGGLTVTFKFSDTLVNWDDKKYVMVTKDCNAGANGCPGADGGVFITEDADATPIVWTELGNATEPPSNSVCGIAAGMAAGVPTFYAQTGNCNGEAITDRMYKFTGTAPGAAWTEIVLPAGGFGVFAVNESNPLTLLASGYTATDAFMYKSIDGGANWTALATLDALMRGGGDFSIKTTRGPSTFTGMNGYRQPSLVAIDPTAPSIMVAGGIDSGIFLSTDSGTSWNLVTDPRNSHTSDIPHIPRPRHAYFDEEGDDRSIFISSQGRGIWRLKLETCLPMDAYEPDNASGQATTITSGVPKTHDVCLIGDSDWSTFTLTDTSSVTLQTSGPAAVPPASADTRMWLRDNNGVQLAYNDDGGSGAFSLLERTCGGTPLGPGTYFVEIDEYGDNNVISSYTLSLDTAKCAFTDDPLTAGVTVLAVHIQELRDRVNALRVDNSLGAFAFTDTTLEAGVTLVNATHVLELRTALNQLYASLGTALPTYQSLAAGTLIRAVHIQELRDAFQNIRP